MARKSLFLSKTLKGTTGVTLKWGKQLLAFAELLGVEVTVWPGGDHNLAHATVNGILDAWLQPM